MKIIFMGTPDFAVPCLESLYNAGHEISSVFTREDKPVGRKQVLTAPPVKVFATEKNIPVFQPKTLRDGEAEKIIKSYNPDLIVVVAYGRILPDEILGIPKFGCVNVHASLLPRHRGASPIQWCIVCGDKKTGITTMKMDSGLDTGDILLTETVDIDDNETAGELFDRLAGIGAELIVKTVDNIESIEPVKQNDEGATYAPIITKNMGLLDFKNKTAEELHNAVRGFNPWPVAYFVLDNKRIKVYKTHIADASGVPGTVVSNKNELIIACAEGTALALDIIKPEGSREMTAEEYLRGKVIEKGAVICG